MMNLASRSNNLVNLDLVDLNRLASFWYSGAKNGESRASEFLPNRPLRSFVCGAILANSLSKQL
jgi:hypothetical protein